MKKLFLLFRTFSICWVILLSLSTSAQNSNPEPKKGLPTVSDEVFQSIVQFYQYDNGISIDARVVSKDKIPGGLREKITFKGANGKKVTSFLVTPVNEAEKFSVVMIVDGIYGSKDRWFEDNSWPRGGQVIRALLDEGFAVMVLDAAYHGERSYEYDFLSPPWPYTYPHEFRRMVIQTATDYRRAIDYLSSRKEIDSERVGMLGLSMGALITFELSSIETRIRTAVAGVVPPLRIPELQAVDVCTFAGRVACDSFLMFMGNQDGLYTMDEARELFERIPIDQKEFIEYEADHRPPQVYVKTMTEWFSEKLHP